MKKTSFIIAGIILALILNCKGQTANEPVKRVPGSNSAQLSANVAGNSQQMIMDSIQSDIVSGNENLKLMIISDPVILNDYIAEHESGVPDTSRYAADRNACKGQIHFPCTNQTHHDFKIVKERIVSIISIKYNSSVLDRTDYIFTRDTIFEVHTSTYNAGIFTDSDIKFIQNNTDFSGLTKSPVRNNEIDFNINDKPCDFNEYLFYLALKFCEKNNIKMK